GDPRLPGLLRHEAAAFVAGVLDPVGVRAISKVSSSTVHKTPYTSVVVFDFEKQRVVVCNGSQLSWRLPAVFRVVSVALAVAPELLKGRKALVGSAPEEFLMGSLQVRHRLSSKRVNSWENSR